MEIVWEIFDQESKYGILFLQNSQKFLSTKQFIQKLIEIS